jgi:hypothetical protein
VAALTRNVALLVCDIDITINFVVVDVHPFHLLLLASDITPI